MDPCRATASAIFLDGARLDPASPIGVASRVNNGVWHEWRKRGDGRIPDGPSQPARRRNPGDRDHPERVEPDGAVARTAREDAGSSDEVLKNVLAAIGFKAYEIASYKVLLTLADAAGATADKAVLEQSSKEEQEMGDWLGSHLPGFVHAFLQRQGK